MPIAFRSAAVGTADDSFGVNVPAPSGLAVGDVLVAFVGYKGNSFMTFTTPAGWTLIRTDVRSGTKQAVFVRVVTTLPLGGTDFSFSHSGDAIGALLAYSGVSSASPVDTHAGQASFSARQTAPAVTTTVADAVVLSSLFVGVANNSLPVPAGTTSRSDVRNVSGVVACQRTVDAVQATPGTAAERVFKTSGFSYEWASATVALTPAPAGPNVYLGASKVDRLYVGPSRVDRLFVGPNEST